MAKWYGKVGYITTKETEPGIWDPEVTEKPYSGDLLSNASRWSGSNKVNDDLTVANRISFIADPFAYQNFSSIKYVEFMGSLWEVSTADASQFPRIIMTLGGVYNGQQATTAE